jgi:segregation and condensation protein B
MNNEPLANNSELPNLSSVVEALLFTSQKALSSKELFSLIKAAATSFPTEAPGIFSPISEQEIVEALQILREDLLNSHRSYELYETASGWQLKTKSSFAPWLHQLFPEARPARLSAPALETLAIIAYRQPMTRADVEAVRGVAVDGVVQTLVDRGLIHIVGRAEVPGRPLLYGTSQLFLDHFGLRSLKELPNSAELGKITLPKASVPLMHKEDIAISPLEKTTPLTPGTLLEEKQEKEKIEN